jgi:hypothetical protein
MTIADALSRSALTIALVSALSIVPNATTAVRQHDHDYMVIYAGNSATFGARAAHARPISELGWTAEQAAAMRHRFAAFADDWDDPDMDVYDAL